MEKSIKLFKSRSQIFKGGYQAKTGQSFYHPHQQALSSTISPAKKLEPNDPVFDLETIKSSFVKDNKLGESALNLGFLSNQKILCMNCKKEFLDFDVQYFWYLDACCHCFCRACLLKYITQEFVKSNGQVKCILQGCKYYLNEGDYKILNFFLN